MPGAKVTRAFETGRDPAGLRRCAGHPAHRPGRDHRCRRYAYTQHPCGNLLYNKEGMPVSPFTTNGY
jgi:hypothetical protein